MLTRPNGSGVFQVKSYKNALVLPSPRDMSREKMVSEKAGKVSYKESISRAIDKALQTRVALQVARRDLSYFLARFEDKDLESAGETPEYTRLALNLREALAESEEAISRLNVELGIDADGEETTAQVR